MAILGLLMIVRSDVPEVNFCFDGLSRSDFTEESCVCGFAVTFGLDFRLELTDSGLTFGCVEGVLYA